MSTETVCAAIAALPVFTMADALNIVLAMQLRTAATPLQQFDRQPLDRALTASRHLLVVAHVGEKVGA